MKTSVQFERQGHIIQGKFYTAATKSDPRPTVLLLAGFPGNEDDVLGLGAELSAHGLNTMTFNYSGTYQSEGDYSLRNSQLDIEAALDFLRDEAIVKKYHLTPGEIVLGGWSYGGGMALSYAANHPDIQHIFSIAGTDHGEFAREYLRNAAFAEMVNEIFDSLRYLDGPVRFSGKAAIREELIQNPTPYDVSSRAPDFVDRNILLIGAWDDLNVTIEYHILPFYRALMELDAENVQLNAFQDNHGFENSRLALANTIVEWLKHNFKSSTPSI